MLISLHKRKTGALKLIAPLLASAILLAPGVSGAASLSIKSADVEDGQAAPQWMEYNQRGCKGDNRSPELSWTGEPQNTQSFAITIFDPDASGPRGWLHWLVVNIPASAHELPAGAGSPDVAKLPPGAVNLKNNEGENGFSGACPPAGDKPHRYQITVYAMPQAQTPIPAAAEGKDAADWLKNNALASSVMTVTYQRQ